MQLSLLHPTSSSPGGFRRYFRRPHCRRDSRSELEATRAYYADKEALADDVVALLRAELEDLRSAGADFVQFDEPVLTDIAVAPGRTRTFMCAALAARRDPAEELEFAVSLINRAAAARDLRGRA